MDENIKIRKFVFTETSPALMLSEEETKEFLNRKSLRIELIEVQDIKNPSDLIIVIKRGGITSSTTPVYLYKYRAKFIYQEGKFILDTQDIKEFLIEVGGHTLDIRIVAADGINKYKIEMYYRTYSRNEVVK